MNDTTIPYMLTIRPEITEDMAQVLDLTDQGKSIRETARILHRPEATTRRQYSQATARRYGLGDSMTALNDHCDRCSGPPPIPTIDPSAINDLDARNIATM